jgi:indole-3-glycerol phosphate synthase
MESGISTRDHVRAAADAGASVILVGEALMRADDPGAKLRELLGRRAER